ncbi:MAG: ion channel [Oleiphilaceae bacterium]|nr:ion channel [Oleiphilaceae bacterium]
MFENIKRIILKHFMDLRWHGIVLAIVFYVIASWVLLRLSGETSLTSSLDYLYWLAVTASTVGYGDLSPQTTGGRIIVSIFVIPLGLGLFGLAIGRIAAFVSYQWRKGIQGLKKLNVKDHILVVGWNGNKTLHLIRLLLREMEHGANKSVVLCVRHEMENPFPEHIGFVRVNSFTTDEDMTRAGVQTASCIIIDNLDDDITMTSSLYCSSQNPRAHIIAYFQQEELGHLLKSHCPNIECMPSVSVEMIAKSAVDPGSSALHHELLDVDKGMTQYSVIYDGADNILVADVFHALKRKYDATLIGIAGKQCEDMEINPALDKKIVPGSTIYYIADERVRHFDWREMSV